MSAWKIAFWSCLMILIFVIGFSAYLIIDQGVTLTYQKEGYIATENDLDEIIGIINGTDLTKENIRWKLAKHNLYEYMDFDTDAIRLYRVSLIFDNDKLKEVQKQW